MGVGEGLVRVSSARALGALAQLRAEHTCKVCYLKTLVTPTRCLLGNCGDKLVVRHAIELQTRFINHPGRLQTPAFLTGPSRTLRPPASAVPAALDSGSGPLVAENRPQTLRIGRRGCLARYRLPSQHTWLSGPRRRPPCARLRSGMPSEATPC